MLPSIGVPRHGAKRNRKVTSIARNLVVRGIGSEVNSSFRSLQPVSHCLLAGPHEPVQPLILRLTGTLSPLRSS